MDLSTLQNTVVGLKTAADIAKSFLDLKSLAEVQGKVIELQSTILATQSTAMSALAEQTSLEAETRVLKEELTKVRAWEQQKQRYKLASPWEGSFVYALRSSSADDEPAHWICTKCYEDGRRSILNPKQIHMSQVQYCCPVCNSEVPTPWCNITAPTFAPE